MDLLKILTELYTYKREIIEIVDGRNFDDRIAAGVAIYARFHPKRHEFLENYYDSIIEAGKKREVEKVIDV